jgi:hypothetical protein
MFKNKTLRPGVVIKFLVIFSLVFVFANPVCIGCKRQLIEQRYEYVTRVFMHAPREYTFFCQSPGSAVITSYHFYTVNAKFLADIPDGEFMWVIMRTRGDRPLMNESASVLDLEMHIHSVKDVNGGGWRLNRGKFGAEEGQTNVVG